MIYLSNYLFISLLVYICLYINICACVFLFIYIYTEIQTVDSLIHSHMADGLHLPFDWLWV